jgi:hypothetical protein
MYASNADLELVNTVSKMNVMVLWVDMRWAFWSTREKDLSESSTEEKNTSLYIPNGNLTLPSSFHPSGLSDLREFQLRPSNVKKQIDHDITP